MDIGRNTIILSVKKQYLSICSLVIQESWLMIQFLWVLPTSNTHRIPSMNEWLPLMLLLSSCTLLIPVKNIYSLSWIMRITIGLHCSVHIRCGPASMTMDITTHMIRIPAFVYLSSSQESIPNPDPILHARCTFNCLMLSFQFLWILMMWQTKAPPLTKTRKAKNPFKHPNGHIWERCFPVPGCLLTWICWAIRNHTPHRETSHRLNNRAWQLSEPTLKHSRQ